MVKKNNEPKTCNFRIPSSVSTTEDLSGIFWQQALSIWLFVRLILTLNFGCPLLVTFIRNYMNYNIFNLFFFQKNYFFFMYIKVPSKSIQQFWPISVQAIGCLILTSQMATNHPYSLKFYLWGQSQYPNSFDSKTNLTKPSFLVVVIFCETRAYKQPNSLIW